MSRKGICWDSAVAESAFATIETELVPQEGFDTRAVVPAAVADHIEVFCPEVPALRQNYPRNRGSTGGGASPKPR